MTRELPKCSYCKGMAVFADTAHGRGVGGQTMTGCPECAATGVDQSVVQEIVLVFQQVLGHLSESPR